MELLCNRTSTAVPLTPAKEGYRMTRATVLFTVSAVLILLLAAVLLLIGLNLSGVEEVAARHRFR